MGFGNEKFVVDAVGKKTAVIMPLHRYKRLLEGLPAANRRRQSSRLKTIVKKNEVKQLLLQLPQSDLIELFEEMESKLETFEMMRLTESGFGEWLETGEDIYEKE